MNKTYWDKTVDADYAAPEQNVIADVAVIGGGLAGIMCAESLSRGGLSVCILEAEKIGAGESSRSSAMLTAIHDALYYDMIKKHGEDKTLKYYEYSERGKAHIISLIKEYGIDCDLQYYPLYLFSTTPGGAKTIDNEEKAYAALGVKYSTTVTTGLPFPVLNALKIENQACLNPYKFVTGLAKVLSERGVSIYEHTRVTQKPEGNRLSVGDYTVTANKFVVATHFPIYNTPGYFFTKMYQSATYNIVFNSDIQLNGIYISAEDKGDEYRPTEKGKIMCGGAHGRTGSGASCRYAAIEKRLKTDFNATESDIVSRFSAEDCITYDNFPFVGTYGRMENTYVVTGFNKWGLTNSAVAAKIIADCILKGEYDKLFSPKRLYALLSPLKAIKNLTGVIRGLAAAFFRTGNGNLYLSRGEGRVIRVNNKRIGAYRSENGKIFTISAVCPHLNCALEWNADERTWDCPCHGSRFDVYGNIIASPSTHNAKTLDNPIEFYEEDKT